MANEVRIRASVKDDASQPLGKIGAAWKQFQDSGSKGGFAIGASAAVAAKGLDLISGAAFGAGRAVGDFVGDSIKAASDLNEAASKSQVIFGGAARDVEAFASSADKNLGLAKSAALDAAASFGNLFLGTGQTSAEAAKLSKSMVTLAGDLASFNNLDVSDTLLKLRSGLTGEAEPLRAVGVFLTEAKVKAKAMELGLADAHGELSEGAKVMARYQIILDETTTAQGDFARTSDGVANSARTQAAELENLQAKLGEGMLPIQKGVTSAQIDLITAFGAFADELSGKVTPETLALDKALGVVAGSYEFSADKLRSMTTETLLAAQALGHLTEEEVKAEFAARGFSEAGEDMGGRITNLKERFPEAGKAADNLAGDIKGIGDKAKTAAVKVGSAMGSIVDSIVDARDDVSDAAAGFADALYDPIIAKGELAALERERAEQKQIIAAKNSTKEQVADAKLRLLELTKDRIAKLAELAGYGDASAKATLKHQLATLESTKNLTLEQKAQIRQLREALAKLEGSYRAAAVAAERLRSARIDGALDRPGQAPRPRAHGGPVTKGEAYIVGEKQAEVFVPNQNGYILPEVPSAPSGGGGGGMGGITFAPTVVVQGLLTPAVKEQIVRDLGPLFATWLRQNGIAVGNR